MSATLKDVAKEAGVSVPTVSRVINEQPYIKEITRKKVLEAIEKLSYQPNSIARNLKQGRTNTVGFIVNDASSSFFGMVALGIERILRKHNYNLILCNTDDRHDLEIDSLKLVVSKKVEGIILATTGSTGEFVKKVIDSAFSRDSELRVIDTICHDIRERQAAALKLAGNVDLMDVDEGHSAINNNRLTELCSTVTETHLVETAEEIQTSWPEGKNSIGVTAGASTAEQEVNEVLRKIKT